MANKNITLKKIGFDKTFLNSRLELNMKGKDVTYPLVNAIRRIALSDLPIYTWKTTITKNNSVFHNNYMRNRVRSIPIIGINNEMLFFQKKEEVDVKDTVVDNFLIMDDIDINSKNDTVDTSSLNNINMYLNYHNTSKEITTVTTDKYTFQYKGEKIDNPYKIPIPIIKLQPNQEINLSSVSNLGTEQNNTSEYSACSIFCYD